MEENSNSLREHYSSLTDDELKYTAITGGLTTTAREVLEQELHHRGISELNEYKEQLQHAKQKRLEKKDDDRRTRANPAMRILCGCAALVANARTRRRVLQEQKKIQGPRFSGFVSGQQIESFGLS